MRGTIILSAPDRFAMTRTASTTTTTTTTTTFSSPANTTATTSSSTLQTALPSAHRGAGSTLVATRHTVRHPAWPTASAPNFQRGATGPGETPPRHHPAREPGVYGISVVPRPDPDPAGESQTLFPRFKIKIHAPGTLKNKDRPSAQQHLVMLDRQLAEYGPATSNTLLDSAWGEHKGKWLKQAIRLMLESDPAQYPPELPARLVALGLPEAAARTFLEFTTNTRRLDLRHHATMLFAAMDHATRTQLLQAAHFSVDEGRTIANAFATHMLGNMHAPLQTGALMVMLALHPDPAHLAMLVDERFGPPLQHGMIGGSIRYDEARAFMDQPGHRASRKMARQLIHRRSANPARHVELLAGYLAQHGRVPETLADLLSHALRNIVSNRELPDHVTAQDIAHGTARQWMGSQATLAVARTMGKEAHERLHALLAQGIASNVPDARGFTALHYAIAASNVDGVRLLLQHAADPLRSGPRRLWPFGGTLSGLPPCAPLKFAQALSERQRSPAANVPLHEIIGLLAARAEEIRTDAGQPLIAVAPATPMRTAHPLPQAESVTVAAPAHGRSVAAQPSADLTPPTGHTP